MCSAGWPKSRSLALSSRLAQPDLELRVGDDQLHLRAWQITDAPALVAAWADPDIARWTAIPPTPSLAYAEQWIAGVETRLERRLAIDVVIETAHTVVGEIGFSHFDQERRAAMVGYWLLPAARGRGLAAASLRALTVWAAEYAKIDIALAECHPANPSSAAVAASAGYAQVASNADRIVMAHGMPAQA